MARFTASASRRRITYERATLVIDADNSIEARDKLHALSKAGQITGWETWREDVTENPELSVIPIMGEAGMSTEAAQ